MKALQNNFWMTSKISSKIIIRCQPLTFSCLLFIFNNRRTVEVETCGFGKNAEYGRDTEYSRIFSADLRSLPLSFFNLRVLRKFRIQRFLFCIDNVERIGLF